MLHQIEWDIGITLLMLALVAALCYIGYLTAKLKWKETAAEQGRSVKPEPSCAEFCANYNVGCEAEMFNSRFECDHFEPRKVTRRKVYDISTGEIVPVKETRHFDPRTGEITKYHEASR